MLDVLVSRLDLRHGPLDQLPHVVLPVQDLSGLLVLVDVDLDLLDQLPLADYLPICLLARIRR